VLYNQTCATLCSVPVSTLLGTSIPANTWVNVTVPFYAFGVTSSTSVSGIAFYYCCTTEQPVYIDLIAYGCITTPGAALPPPTSYIMPSTGCDIAFSSCPASFVQVWNNGLASGWCSWSWGTNGYVISTAYSLSGQSLEYTPNDANGLYLHTSNYISGSTYNALKFSIFSPTGGQSIEVILYDENTNELCSSYTFTVSVLTGASIPVNTWVNVTVPFYAFGVSSSTSVSGIAFFYYSAEQPVYIDLISYGCISSP